MNVEIVPQCVVESDWCLQISAAEWEVTFREHAIPGGSETRVGGQASEELSVMSPTPANSPSVSGGLKAKSIPTELREFAV